MALEHIILSLTSGTPRWWHPVLGEGTGDLATMPAQGRHALTVLVPGRDVLLTRVTLPTGNRQRLRQALPFALEDQLVQDVDQYHFSLGPRLSNAADGLSSHQYLAAAVALSTMQGWMEVLEQAGLKPDALLPQPLALPLPATAQQANVLIDGGVALVRTGTQEAFEASVADLDLLLSLQPEIQRLQVADAQGQWPDNGRVSRQSLNMDGWPQDFCVAPGKTPLNLLQGAWQARGDSVARITRVWRWAAMAMCAVGVLTLVNRYLEVAELKNQMRTLDAAARQVVTRVVPQIPPGSSYRKVLDDNLSRLQGPRGSAENGFFYLLEIIGPALVQGGGARLASVNFRSDGMVLDLTATSLDQVETLRRQISEQAPVPVVIESSETVVDGTRVRMRIGGEVR